MFSLITVLLFGVALRLGTADHHAEMITINNETTTCGEEKTVVAGNEFIVKSMGESPGVDCSYVFKGQMRDNCMGLCYDMKTGSVFRDAKASLTVVAGTYSKVFDINEMTAGPWCSEEFSMSLSLTVASDYVNDPQNPGFDFSISVYNKCGQPDSGRRSITYEEAAKNLDGYHHGEEFDDRTHMTLVYGLVVGFGLASMFLILLCITYCYVRNNPNRGQRASAREKSKNLGTPMSARQPNKRQEDVELLAVTSDQGKTPH